MKGHPIPAGDHISVRLWKGQQNKWVGQSRFENNII